MLKTRFWVTILTMCVCIDATAQNVPSDKPAFTEFVAQMMRAELGNVPVAVTAPLTLSVGSLQANLDRVYEYCHAKGAACGPELRTYVQGAAQVLKQQNAPLEKSSVLLAVRTDAYIIQSQATMGAAQALPKRPLGAGLVVIAVLDTPRKVRPLSERDLKTLDVTEEQLFELGAQNLRAQLKPLLELVKPVSSGQIGSVAGDLSGVARIALPEQWAGLAAAQQGNLIIVAPTKDVVLYVSESTPAAKDALLTLANNIAIKAANPLAPKTLLKWSNAGWESAE